MLRSLGRKASATPRAHSPLDPSWRTWASGPVPSPVLPQDSHQHQPPSRSPRTQLPAPHWPAWEHLPLFGQAAPGRLHPQPSLSLSLRLFEVCLWGPGGRHFKHTFWLSHFLTAPVLGAAAAAAARVTPSLRGPGFRGPSLRGHLPHLTALMGSEGRSWGGPSLLGSADHLVTHLDPSAAPTHKPGAWEVCPELLLLLFPTPFSSWACEQTRLHLHCLLSIHNEVCQAWSSGGLWTESLRETEMGCRLLADFQEGET